VKGDVFAYGMREEERGDCAFIDDVQATRIMQVSPVSISASQTRVKDEFAQ